jgi:cation transport ATPase
VAIPEARLDAGRYTPGDTVIGATINTTGSLRVRAEKVEFEL